MNTREATIRHVKDLTFIGKAGSNHWTVIDSSHHGNTPSATSPMELVLIALGSCTGSDVAIIMEKKRILLSKFEMRITGERAVQDPKVYTSIHIEYLLEGTGVKEKDAAHAVELSMTKYCSVSAMLKKSVHISTSIIITEAAGPAG